ncbi:hypothetical protein RJZ56_001677 [Blastomyces dermatitidis]
MSRNKFQETFTDQLRINSLLLGTWSKGSSKAVTPTKVEIGHEFQPVSIDQYAGRWLFLNTTYWDFGVNGEEPSPHRPLGHPLAQCSSVESFLLDYFIRGIASFCSLSTGFNPYLSLVTPLALNYQQPHEPLRNILLAIAANQRHILGDSTYEREAFLFKQKALHGLQNEINHRKPSAGAVATITDGCTPSWTTHLRGGLQLMEMFPHQMCESETLKRFFVMYFVAHYIMGRTGVEDPSEVPQVALSWLDDDDLEETCMLKMALKAMKTHQLTLQEISNFNTARIDIEAELRVLHQKLPSYASLQEDLLRIAETKRLAAILYLRERLGSPTGLCYFYPVEKFSPHQDHKHKHNNSINSPLSHQATTLSVVV